MRRRAMREMGTILGIVVILAVIVLANSQLRRGSLKTQMERVRRNAEAKREEGGVPILSWDILRETTGSRKKGPTFDERLVEQRDSTVNLIGFMVPEYEFRQMQEFMLLPVPIECYFCESPPMRDVMLIQMAEGSVVDLVNEPVLIHGELTLNEGPGTKFFYVIKNADRGPAEEGAKFTRRSTSEEAMGHAAQMKEKLDGVTDNLEQGFEPPPTAEPPQ